MARCILEYKIIRELIERYVYGNLEESVKMSWSVMDSFMECGVTPGCLGWICVANEEYSRWKTLGQVDHGKSEVWIYDHSHWKTVKVL